MTWHNRWTMALLLVVAQGAATAVHAQERGFLSRDTTQPPPPAAAGRPAAAHNPNVPERCRGPVSRVQDIGIEAVRTTSYNYGTAGGGGEGGRFDPTPVLSNTVTLAAGTCLNAHLSALVGSRQTYPGVASITMFQVTLTPAAGGPPRHMVGHYHTPYGIPAPAVAIEAERDVDMFAANFYQPIGSGPGTLPPGTYRVDVWWAGGPVGGGGAIAAAFVLKLYSR